MHFTFFTFTYTYEHFGHHCYHGYFAYRYSLVVLVSMRTFLTFLLWKPSFRFPLLQNDLPDPAVSEFNKIYLQMATYVYSGVRQNECNWFQNLVRYSNCSFQHTLKYTYLGAIRSRPTAYSKVTIQHNHLNRKKMMIYLTAIGLTPGGSSTVHIYTRTIHEQHNRHKTIHRTTQLRKSKNYKCENNIKLIYLTFIHCTCKF